jgi:biotin operon repressor
LLAYLASNPNTSATKLAGIVGVSRASIYRMMDTARDAFGVEIVCVESRYRIASLGVLNATAIDILLKEGIYKLDSDDSVI